MALVLVGLVAMDAEPVQSVVSAAVLRFGACTGLLPIPIRRVAALIRKARTAKKLFAAPEA